MEDTKQTPLSCLAVYNEGIFAMTAMGKKEARGMAKYEGRRKDMGRSVAQLKEKQKIGNRLCIKLEKLCNN